MAMLAATAMPAATAAASGGQNKRASLDDAASKSKGKGNISS
jgi:hypothetical protein